MQIKVFVTTHEKGYIRRKAIELTNIFGGCTVYQNCIGFWKNESKIIVDNVTVIEIFIDTKTFHDKQCDFHKILAKIKKELKQKCIAYTINYKILFK